VAYLGRVSVDELNGQLGKMAKAIGRGEKPCAVCKKGLLLRSCLPYTNVRCGAAIKSSKPTRRKTGRQREVSWLEKLFQLQDRRA
jgi:hypothetical protein